LGAETDICHWFIVLHSRGKSGLQPVAAATMVERLPASRFQGILFQSRGEASCITGQSGRGLPKHATQVLEEINRLNGILLYSARSGDSDAHQSVRTGVPDAKFRPELTEFSKESRTLIWYGFKRTGRRKLRFQLSDGATAAERGVRFIHCPPRLGTIMERSKRTCRRCEGVDQASPLWSLILKQRGLLDDTLIIWAAQFGRTRWARVPGATIT